MESPVDCPTEFRTSSIPPAWDASMPNALRTDDTLSMEVDTSVSFKDANSTNCWESFFSLSPVRPNLVFTSPIAEPAVAKSVGMDVAISFAASCISFNALPLAPVFCVTISAPSSTSLKAARDAAPTAAIGAVTWVEREVPTPVILSPTSFIFCPAC